MNRGYSLVRASLVLGLIAAVPAALAGAPKVDSKGTRRAVPMAVRAKAPAPPKTLAPRTLTPATSADPLARAPLTGRAWLDEAAIKGRPLCPDRRKAEPVRTALAPASALASTTFTDLTANEVLLGASLTKVKPSADDGTLLRLPNGDICLLGHREYEVFAKVSTDGGATFGAAVTIAGATKRVVGFSATATWITGSRNVYVALAVVDPSGDYGLQFVSSADAGRTWIAPKDLVKSGDASHGVASPKIALGRTGSNDVLAIAYAGQEESYPYAIVSQNGGSTWATPVKLETNSQQTWTAPTGIDVEVDHKTGAVYVAYAQGRSDADSSDTHVFFTRSTNFGTSFTVETDLVALEASTGYASAPEVEVSYGTSTTNVLVAYHDTNLDFYIGELRVLRSTNAGVDFSDAMTPFELVNELIVGPFVFADGTSDQVLMLVAEGGAYNPVGYLEIFNSADNGASWTPPNDSGVIPGFAMERYPIALAARMPNGTWHVAWTDDAEEMPDGFSFFGTLTNVYTLTSSNGIDWPRAASTLPTLLTRVSDGNGGYTFAPNTQGLLAVVPSSSDTALYLFADERESNGASTALWVNRASGVPADVVAGAEKRVSDDAAATLAPRAFDTPSIASDGKGTMYVAVSATVAGNFNDLYVYRTDTAGFTFATPVKVGDTDPATWNDFEPRIAATPDGHVYLVYLSDDGTYNPDALTQGRSIRFNRSTDYGATWQPHDVELDRNVNLFPTLYLPDYPHVQIATGPSNQVYILWSSGTDLKLQRSTDGGQTFQPVQVIAGNSLNSYAADGRICVFGSKVVVAYAGTPTGGTNSIWGLVSTNSGQSFTSANVRNDTGSLPSDFMYFPISLACDAGTSKAVVLWSDFTTSFGTEVRAAQFNGTAWSTSPVTLPTPTTADAIDTPYAAYTSSGTGKVAVAVLDYYGGGVYLIRSADNGATWATPVRVDKQAGNYGSDIAQIATDGNDNVWVHWFDFEPSYYGAIVTRHSADGGATFDANVLRLDRSNPAGALPISYDVYPVSLVSDKVLYVVYTAWRNARHYEPVFQAHDLYDPTRTKPYQQADGNRSNRVDGLDLILLSSAYGRSCGQTGYDRRADFNKDCTVDGSDLTVLGNAFGLSR